MTLMSLSSCFVICSTGKRLVSTAIVMRERSGSSVGLTARESMLNPRRVNRPATRTGRRACSPPGPRGCASRRAEHSGSSDGASGVAPGRRGYPCPHGGPPARRRGRSAGPSDADPRAAATRASTSRPPPTAPRRWRRCGRRGRTCCCSTCCCPTPTASSCRGGLRDGRRPGADPDAHRPRHGVGPGGGLRGRRRRLPGQAVLHGRADRARAGPAAAGARPPGAHDAPLRRPRTSTRPPTRCAAAAARCG